MIEWKTLTLADRPYIEDMLKRYPLYLSDYNFTNFWIWNCTYHFKHAMVENFLCFKLNPHYFLYPIGEGSRKYVIELLAQDEPLFQIRAIPEQAAEEFEALIPEPERFDYLYSYTELLNLPGNRYQAKRNLIHQFVRRYPFEYRPIDADLIPEIIAMQKSWHDQHSGVEMLANEHLAALRCLKYFNELNVHGGVLLVDGRVIAYSVAEYTAFDTLQIHLEKAFIRYKGAYQVLNQQLLQHAQPVKYVNREENLGSVNLKRAKESYHPLRLIKKFKLKLK